MQVSLNGFNREKQAVIGCIKSSLALDETRNREKIIQIADELRDSGEALCSPCIVAST